MHKKMFFSFMLVGILFFGFTKANIQNVNISYCEDVENPRAGLSKTYFVEPGQEKEICIYMFSNDSVPVEVAYGFPNPEKNANGDQGCSSDMGPDNEFSKFFVHTGERKIVLEPGVAYTIKEKFFAPVGMSGEVNGCFVYTLGAPTKQDGNMFSVVTRKVYFLNFFVGGNETIKNEVELLKNSGGVYSTNSKVKAIVDKENNLSLDFKVKNNGNVTQNIVITGKIYNVLGFEKKYENTPININPGDTKDININVGILPAYKGFFTIKYTLINDPVFGFDTSNMKEESKIGGMRSDKAKVFVFSWVMMIIIIIVIFGIVKLLLPRKVKIIKE